MKATATFEKKNNGPKKDKKQSDNKFPFFGSKKGSKKDAKKEDCGCEDKKKKCKDCDKKKKKKVNETSGIMSFKQFLNESHDFQNKFAPENFNGEDDEDDNSIIPMEGSETESQDDETFHSDSDTQMAHDEPGHHAGIEDESDEDDSDDDFDTDDSSDTWNGGGDDFEDDADDEPVIPKRGTSKIDKINSELMSVNSEIGRLLDQYKSDNDIQNYKKQASPLLAKRKELQAQLDAQFNVSGETEDDFSDLEMQDADFSA